MIKRAKAITQAATLIRAHYREQGMEVWIGTDGRVEYRDEGSTG